MSGEAAGLELRAERDGKKYKVTALVNGDVIFVDTIDPASAAHRVRFARAVHAKCPAVTPDLIDAELLRVATTPVGPSPPAEANEVDVRRVVRPDLFHTRDVSGVTVSVVLDAGGKLVPRWRTYLRWADGRREVIDTPDRIALPGGSTLYLHPDPGEPPGSEPPAWSAVSRRDWLAGSQGPDPAAVFRRVCELIARYLDFPPEAAAGTTATVALWAMFSHMFPAWGAVPYLYVGGPMGSGKSRVLDVLQRLAFRPVSSSNLTAPALFRTLHAYGGTMLYDEAERLRQGTPDVQELLSVFQAGYKRGGCATRLEPVGDGFRPVRFEVFGPKALACIAGLPPVLTSRCISVMMFRSPEDSPKPKRRLDADPGEWQAPRDDLHALALEYGPTWVELASRTDVVPAGIAGRNYEIWQPLLALAGWLQDRGADGLLGLLQQHAVGRVTSDRDDAIPEADEVLLELLAEAIREFRHPTPGELLKDAKGRDDVTFKLWQPAGVSRRLKNYSIPIPRKVNGERRYREVTPEVLRRIGERYGIDLGFPGPGPTRGTDPHRP
jgi:hypothetical protein